MIPIGPLMSEHRLIEKMIQLVKRESERIRGESKIDPKFIDIAVDFFRTYADKCHHGKEENILFRDLNRKPLRQEHRKILDELIAEHAYARKTVTSLSEAKEDYVQGKTKSQDDIQIILKTLAELYPIHIEKEDKNFFYPVMDYFSKQELDEMLKEFWDFDRKVIHERYREMIEGDKASGQSSAALSDANLKR